jgi:FtsP/CotA-like multicopper oxidase with cupredoxin domain
MRETGRVITRREVLQLSGVVAATVPLTLLAQDLSAPDYRLEIAPTILELAPRRSLRTLAYNGQVPGPLLRMKEGRPVTVEVTNRSDRPEVVHWHGQFLPPAIDGAAEEGTPLIAPGATARYTITPRPAGFRWYHTHTMAMNDLTRAQYGGQHGPVWIEPRDNPGRQDQELFLVLHDWDGRLTGSDDGAMNPVYAVSAINGKALGAGEPLRVRAGEHVLLHILNSSPTEVHWVALAGHQLQVVALDGNPVPAPRSVPMLRLAPAERVCAMVVMDNPGVWIFGEVRRHVQAAGMGVVVEYADRAGAARWQQPEALVWDYAQFGARPEAVQPAATDTGHGAQQVVPLVFESKFRGHGAMEAWTINGRSWPDSAAPPLLAGRRYRLRLINRSNDDHPVHLHRHSFELRVLGAPLAAGDGTLVPRGILKDVVLVDAQTRAEVEFTADNPGDTLFHCHQQNHMDLGFMMLFKYA